MTIVEIPTRWDIANYVQTTVIGGKTFLLEFLYNDRDSSWYLTISDVTGSVIRSGIKLVPNFFFLKNLVDPKWNIGQLAISNSSGFPPVLGDLGSNSRLLYFEN